MLEILTAWCLDIKHWKLITIHYFFHIRIRMKKWIWSWRTETMDGMCMRALIFSILQNHLEEIHQQNLWTPFSPWWDTTTQLWTRMRAQHQSQEDISTEQRLILAHTECKYVKFVLERWIYIWNQHIERVKGTKSSVWHGWCRICNHRGEFELFLVQSPHGILSYQLASYDDFDVTAGICMQIFMQELCGLALKALKTVGTLPPTWSPLLVLMIHP